MRGNARGLATAYVSVGWPRHTTPINVLQVVLVFLFLPVEGLRPPCRGGFKAFLDRKVDFAITERVSSSELS